MLDEEEESGSKREIERKLSSSRWQIQSAAATVTPKSVRGEQRCRWMEREEVQREMKREAFSHLEMQRRVRVMNLRD